MLPTDSVIAFYGRTGKCPDAATRRGSSNSSTRRRSSHGESLAADERYFISRFERHLCGAESESGRCETRKRPVIGDGSSREYLRQMGGGRKQRTGIVRSSK